MITHLLDTSVYSQPLKKRPLPSVIDRWSGLGDGSLAISAVCEAELMHGLWKRDVERLWADYRTILENRLLILPVDKSVADLFGQLRAHTEKIGTPRSEFDLLIAATARHHDLVIATCNVRHFVGLPGLRVEDWSVPG